MCALKTKIACNGVRPKKSDVYTLAAELVELEGIGEFRAAITEALKSYDYYDYYGYYDYDDYYNDYYYYNDYCHHNDDYYYYYYSYNDYSLKEKVIALLILAAKYLAEGN